MLSTQQKEALKRKARLERAIQSWQRAGYSRVQAAAIVADRVKANDLIALNRLKQALALYSIGQASEECKVTVMKALRG